MNKSKAMKNALLKISGGLTSAFGDSYSLPEGIQECFDALVALDEDVPEWNGKCSETEDDLIMQCMNLAFLVNQHTDFCTFVRFYGHVNKCEIEIRAGKDNWQSEILSTEFTTEYRKHLENKDKFSYYRAKRDILRHILQEKDIPYDECDVEIIQYEEYSF